MLFVLPRTTWSAFLQTTLTCAAGVMILGMAFTGYARGPVHVALRWLLGLSGLLLVAPGLFVATGFSGHGFGIGPGAGRRAADLIASDPPVVDPAPFRVDRFARTQASIERLIPAAKTCN